MDFKLALTRAWAIVTLDREAIREVAGDENALVPALVITAIGGLLGSLVTMNPVFWVGGVVFSLVALVVFAGILYLLAVLFGGQGDFLSLFRVLGHGSGLVSWAGIVPVVGSLAGLWSIPIAVIAVEDLYGLTRGKAIAVVLIPVAVLLLLFCAGLAVVGGSFLAMMARHGG